MRPSLPRSRTLLPQIVSLIMLTLGVVSWACLYAYAEATADKTPITVEEMEAEWTAAIKEKRPFKIENRIIEGRKAGMDSGTVTPLDYLNSRWVEEGPGITLIRCEIKGDVDFVKHARPVSEVRHFLGDEALMHVKSILAKRVAVIVKEIKMEFCSVTGSLRASAGESPLLFPDAVTVFQKWIHFSSKVGGKAYFAGSNFGGSADFSNADFRGRVSFGLTRFGGRADFGLTEFDRSPIFGFATFDGEASFSYAKFEGGAGFVRTEFGGWVSFANAKFGGGANFRMAKFGGRAEFSSTEFGGWVSFANAKFGGRAEFSSTEFGGEATFAGTHFPAGLDAKLAQFRDAALFSGALFKGDIDFGGVDFRGHVDFSGSRFAAGSLRVKTPVNFNLCTFRSKTDFTNARFQEPAIFSSSVIQSALYFDNVRFEDDLDLSGVLLGNHGALSFVGARCEDIFFGVSKPTTPKKIENVHPAVERAKITRGQPLYEELVPGCSIDLTGGFYARLLFLAWSKLRPAVEQSLIRMGFNTVDSKGTKAQQNDIKGKTSESQQEGRTGRKPADEFVQEQKERQNAAIAALRRLAKNYQEFGSKADAIASYKFYREKRMQYQGTYLDWFIWATTGFGADKSRLLYWFLGFWLIPWFLGYWRQGVIVAADKDDDYPNDTLCHWVESLGGSVLLRRLRMVGFSLWFSFNMFVPGIEVVGYKRWESCTDKIHKYILIRYNTLATLQRIGGWLLIPIAIAAFSGLFQVR